MNKSPAADLVLTEGFGLEVDGRMKTVFPTLQAAQKRARDLKAEFPMLQIKVYDAAERTRTHAGGIATGQSDPHRRMKLEWEKKQGSNGCFWRVIADSRSNAVSG